MAAEEDVDIVREYLQSEHEGHITTSPLPKTEESMVVSLLCVEY